VYLLHCSCSWLLLRVDIASLFLEEILQRSWGWHSLFLLVALLDHIEVQCFALVVRRQCDCIKIARVASYE
jgi:hypothetical protein